MNRKSALSVFFFGLIYLNNISAHAQLNTIDDVRNKIFYSEFDLEKSIALIDEINTLNITEPIVKAYEGATNMLAAKYSWNPIAKITYLKDGISKINEAVINDKTNIEIRFLRFYTQNSLPRYLGLSDDLVIDKRVILDQLENVSRLGLTRDIVLYINQYMIDSGQCTTQELEKINNVMTNLELEGS